MAGFDNLRQEAMRRVKEVQQNASGQENNSRHQTGNGSRGSFPNQSNTGENPHFPSGTNNQQNNQSDNRQNNNRSNQHENTENRYQDNTDYQSLAQSFSGDDMKAAKTGGEILDACFHDKEKSLILILILLLSSDNADTGLLLALMYLLI